MLAHKVAHSRLTSCQSSIVNTKTGDYRPRPMAKIILKNWSCKLLRVVKRLSYWGITLSIFTLSWSRGLRLTSNKFASTHQVYHGDFFGMNAHVFCHFLLAQKVTKKGTTPDSCRETNRLLGFVAPPAPGPAELAVRTFRGQPARRQKLLFYSPTVYFTATGTDTRAIPQ